MTKGEAEQLAVLVEVVKRIEKTNECDHRDIINRLDTQNGRVRRNEIRSSVNRWAVTGGVALMVTILVKLFIG